MVTKTTVVCWIVGLSAVIAFINSMGMMALLAGQYMIVSVLILLGAMYFNVEYKKKARLDARLRLRAERNTMMVSQHDVQETLRRLGGSDTTQETLDREKARLKSESG